MDLAFSEGSSSDLITAFEASLRESGKSELNVGSLCSGWGVAEMVLSALNDKLREVHGTSCVQAGFVVCEFF